jgi:hypothetical protein
VNWKQLYAKALTRDGGVQEVARRGVLAAHQRGGIDVIQRLAVGRRAQLEFPVYALCATLDAYGVDAPDDASAP